MEQLRLFCHQLFGGSSPSSGAAVRCSTPATVFSTATGSSTLTIGPGLYPTVGNRLHDLLVSGFDMDKKFAVTTYADGVSVTSSCRKGSEAIMCDILASIKMQDARVDVKSTSESTLSVTMRTEGLAAAGFNTICTMYFHDLSAGKAELQYLHDYAGISAGVTLKRNPLMSMSGLLGTKQFALGADLDYDTTTARFIKYDVAIRLNIDGLFSSIVLSEKGDNLTAGYYHLINKEDKLAVGAELRHNFSSKKNIAAIGLQQSLDSQTVIKFRHTNNGVASLLIQHEFMPKSFLTVSGEINTKTIRESPKIGLALILKP